MEQPNFKANCSSHLSEESINTENQPTSSLSEETDLDTIEKMNQQSGMITLHQLDQIQALIRAD